MIKINDKNIYDDSVKEMFKDYEETTKSLEINKNYKTSIDIAEDTVSIIDNVINAAKVCPDTLTQMRMYLIIYMIGGMCFSATQNYSDDKLDEITPVINKLAEILSDVLGD